VLVLSVMLSSMTAFAQDPDCRGMSRELAEANPSQVGAMYVKLVEACPGYAGRVTQSAIPRAIPNEGGRAAAVAAVKVGQGDVATEWISGLQPDDRAKAIGALGKACNDNEQVQDFFIGAASSMGDSFWSDRWYRALGVCHAVPIQDLLWTELDKGIGADRTLFFGILEAYARSAEGGAVPRLTELSKRLREPEAEVNIINAFSDAAQVGGIDGMNVQTAKAATKAIVEMAPSMSQKGVEQARITLIALGAELESDELAATRYADLQQEDGFVWGVVVSETAPCKGGKKVMQRMHWARAVDGGTTWADQALEKVQSSAEVAWELDLASRCKVEGETTYHVSNLPFATDDELKAWATSQMEELTNAGAKKVFRVEEEPLNL